MDFTSSSPWPTGAAPGLDKVTYSSPALTDSRWTMAALGLVLITLILYRAVFGDAKAKFSPSHLFNSYLINPIIQRHKAWKFLLDGPGIIQAGYDQSNDKPFEILSPDTRHIFITNPSQLAEMDAASTPGNALSLYAASQRALQPMYTMHRFGWYDVPPEGLGYVRALRTLLTNHLPNLLPELGGMMGRKFEELRSQGDEMVDGERRSRVARMIVKMVVLANARSIFSEELAKNDEFVEAALTYIEQLVICAEIIRLVPSWLAPIVGRLVGRRNAAQRVLYNTLMPIAQRRCEERELASQGQQVPKHNDCFQWIMESSTAKTPRTAVGLVHELMAIWFASVHPTAITITIAIHDLCLHPEYLEPLRMEISESYADFERTGQGLPLLDSFIKESARLNPVESISTRRCAVRPFSFADGTSLAVGDWACTPVASILRSARFYEDPLVFSGFRFAPADALNQKSNPGGTDETKVPRQANPSKLVDVDSAFYMWGSGRQTCPGRYYASALAKVILAHIIANFDVKLVDPDASRTWTYRSSRIPREDTMVVFTPLETTC
ncbi:cytochrome P450 [Echria macrotheca]|uniref:Cytochrome P450 n=1 Tax=Echria macrotheca TaxID=438768 RepID=A0AAJ0BH94_9PEZI|nr:cytochrome P450 [Echria macrotheca]